MQMDAGKLVISVLRAMINGCRQHEFPEGSASSGVYCVFASFHRTAFTKSLTEMFSMWDLFEFIPANLH